MITMMYTYRIYRQNNEFVEIETNLINLKQPKFKYIRKYSTPPHNATIYTLPEFKRIQS
jgi:hypothetical protein